MVDTHLHVWHVRACAPACAGHAKAQYSLGLMLISGTGVEKNPAEAVMLLRKAAALGHAKAQQFVQRLGGVPAKP